VLQDMVQAAGSSSGNGAAMAFFFANAIKEHGAIGPAATLARMAVSIAPSDPGASLGLMHVLELSHDFFGVLAAAAQLCRSTHVRLGGGVDLQVGGSSGFCCGRALLLCFWSGGAVGMHGRVNGARRPCRLPGHHARAGAEP
jgi:hypothetical protein